MKREFESSHPDNELAEVLKEAARRRPNIAGGLEDATARQDLLSKLIKIRKALRITQRQVAERMQTTQSAVSDLETGSIDPYFSTLQRYARAVTARLRVRVEFPHDAVWSDVWMYERNRSATHVNASSTSPHFADEFSRRWKSAVETRPDAAKKTPAVIKR